MANAKLSKQDGRNELRKLMDRFPGSSRSQIVRTELSDTIVAAYVGGYIERDEYHVLMADVA